eukprot:3144450-Amphidinium_carterae.1
MLGLECCLLLPQHGQKLMASRAPHPPTGPGSPSVPEGLPLEAARYEGQPPRARSSDALAPPRDPRRLWFCHPTEPLPARSAPKEEAFAAGGP